MYPRYLTSAHKSSISLGRDWLTPATAEEATAMTLSPRAANSSSVLASSEDANIIRTLAGSHCRKSSRRSVPLATAASGPSSCCIRLSS